MKIALIGHGGMGRLIERLGSETGHEIGPVIDESAAGWSAEQLAEHLRGTDAVIDFSVAAAVERNVRACLLAGVPLVEGTTGWNDRRDAIRELVEAADGALVFGANFSVGVNLFYRIVSRAAELVSKFDDYEVFIEERHHSRKKDAPSGTALKLKELLSADFGETFSVSSTRAGDIPGTHVVGFDSAPDTIELRHTARNREGFARGAIFAAEWIVGKKGFFEFSQVIDAFA